jgi:hypothetical protein
LWVSEGHMHCQNLLVFKKEFMTWPVLDTVVHIEQQNQSNVTLLTDLAVCCLRAMIKKSVLYMAKIHATKFNCLNLCCLREQSLHNEFLF